MHTLMLYKKFLLTFFLISFFSFNSCGIWKPADAKKVPTNASDRVKKNMEEGRGFRLGSIGKNSNTFQFASSNPLWRASLEKLSFAPLSNVDYAGGVIVTDWFNDGSSNEQIKITVRFLSNEIRSDALNIQIHKKVCNTQNNCKISKIENSLNSEIRFAILKKATQIKKAGLDKTKDKIGDVNLPKNF